MERITQWFRANNLCMNASKTQFQIFPPNRNQIISTDITVDGICINSSNVVNLLGLYLDSGLNFAHHVGIICEKLGKSKLHFAILKNYLDCNSKRLLYYSYFYSHLVYGIHIWGNAISAKDKTRIYIIQKKYLRQWCTKTQKIHFLKN